MSTVLGSRTHTPGNVQHGETGTPHLTRTERAVRPATYKPKGQKLLVRVRKKHQGLSKSTVMQKKIPQKICENWQSSRFISCQMATYVGSWLTGVVNDTVCRHVYTIGSDTRSVSFSA